MRRSAHKQQENPRSWRKRREGGGGGGGGKRENEESGARGAGEETFTALSLHQTRSGLSSSIYLSLSLSLSLSHPPTTYSVGIRACSR